MKYIKRFNERLDIETYKQASKKLGKMGFGNRSDKLSDFAKKKELEKVKKEIKEYQKEYSKYGTYKLRLKLSYDKNIIYEEHNFHFYIMFKKEDNKSHLNLEPGVQNKLELYFHVIPADDEAVNYIIDKFPPFEENISFNLCDSIISIPFKVKSMFHEIGDIKMEPWDKKQFGLVLLDRISGQKLKNILYKIFNDANFDYPAYFNSDETMHNELISYIAREGLETDWGLSMEEIAKKIKEINVNKFISEYIL